MYKERTDSVHTHMYVCTHALTHICLSVKLNAARVCSIKEALIGAWAIISSDLPPQGQQRNERAGQPALQAMLTASERSCHVSWQLTQWIWILQHKVGLFPLCLCFPGNVPSSCFHIDLITQPW